MSIERELRNIISEETILAQESLFVLIHGFFIFLRQNFVYCNSERVAP